MNDDSSIQETLQRVSQNDHTLTMLYIDVRCNDQLNCIGKFNSGSQEDFSRLGSSIAMNTHIKTLYIDVLYSTRVSTEFYDGLRHNSSIQKVMLRYTGNTLGDVGNELMRVYQDNKRLIEFGIIRVNLQQNETERIGLTLKSCTNLKEINLCDCYINHERLPPLVEAMRGQSTLEELYLNDNSIGNSGCEILAALLEDPNSNLEHLQLETNNIKIEGAVILVNSLANNTKLKILNLHDNSIETSVEDIFSRLLCNTSSINATYSSNHTLQELDLYNNIEETRVGRGLRSEHLQDLLLTNEYENKGLVAIKKILLYHPNIDMEPLYNWDVDGERTLKSLPYVIAWFERAMEAVSYIRSSEFIHIEYLESKVIKWRKLSAIYQFARAMPLQFVSPTHTKLDEKRMRDAN